MRNRLTILLLIFSLAISIGKATSQISYTRIEYSSTFFDRYHKLTEKARTEIVGYEKFDERNDVIEEGTLHNSIDGVRYNDKYGDTDRVTFRNYDSFGKLTEESEWQYVKNEKRYEIYKTYYYYNDKKQRTKELKQNSDCQFCNSSTSKTYNYSDKRIIIIDSAHGFPANTRKKDLEAGRDTLTIDSLGRTTGISYYSSANGFIYKRVFLFDKFNRGETELRYDGEPDKLFLVTDFQYGPNKKLLHYLEIMV